MSEFVPESAPSKDIISIWSRRAGSGPNRNNLFSKRQIRERYQNVLVSFPNRYLNVCPFVFDITTSNTLNSEGRWNETACRLKCTENRPNQMVNKKRKLAATWVVSICLASRSDPLHHQSCKQERISWARIFKRLWSPGIDSKASIPPAYVAWRAGTITLFLLGA